MLCCLNCLKVTRKKDEAYHKLKMPSVNKYYQLKPKVVLCFEPAWTKSVMEEQLKLSKLKTSFC